MRAEKSGAHMRRWRRRSLGYSEPVKPRPSKRRTAPVRLSTKWLAHEKPAGRRENGIRTTGTQPIGVGIPQYARYSVTVAGISLAQGGRPRSCQGAELQFLPPLALLLQAVPEDAAEGAPSAAEEVAAAVEQSTLLGLLGEVGPVGLVVFAILAVMSVVSWALAISKHRLLSGSEASDRSFRQMFRKARSLPEINTASAQYPRAPLLKVFQNGYREVARQVNSVGSLRSPAALERTLALSVSRETRRLQSNLRLLATTASSAPFIGLFGTVWGVLEAFRGLGTSSGATLRAVAPGIAEALLATALGLFTAIPALMFYNVYAGRVREIRRRMQDFGLEFHNLAERDYGATDGGSAERS